MFPAASAITNSGHPYLQQGETHCFNRVLRATEWRKEPHIESAVMLTRPPQTSDYIYTVPLMSSCSASSTAPIVNASKQKGEVFPQRHTNWRISWHLLDRVSARLISP